MFRCGAHVCLRSIFNFISISLINNIHLSYSLYVLVLFFSHTLEKLFLQIAIYDESFMGNARAARPCCVTEQSEGQAWGGLFTEVYLDIFPSGLRSTCLLDMRRVVENAPKVPLVLLAVDKAHLLAVCPGATRKLSFIRRSMSYRSDSGRETARA